MRAVSEVFGEGMVEAECQQKILDCDGSGDALVIALARGEESKELPSAVFQSSYATHIVPSGRHLFGVRLQSRPVSERVDTERRVPITSTRSHDEAEM